MGTGNEDTPTAAPTKEEASTQRRSYLLVDHRYLIVVSCAGFAAGLALSALFRTISPGYGPAFALVLDLATTIGALLALYWAKRHGARATLVFTPTPPGIEVETRP